VGEVGEVAGADVRARDRSGTAINVEDLFGSQVRVVGAGVAAAGRPRLSMRLMLSLLYVKHAFDVSDQGRTRITLVIVIAVAPVDIERAAPPQWMTEVGAEPFYVRGRIGLPTAPN
jgi:hypothetical protein